MLKIEGLIAAPYTPFDNKGELNTSIIPMYANYLKKCGVSGVFANGTTGEGASLTIEERKTNAEAWIKHKSPNFKIMIHVGHNSLKTSQQLAEHAETIEADGIGAMSAYFYKPESVSALVALNKELAASAPSMPYFYYHIPSMTGVNFPMIDFLKHADNQIPNFVGIKYTHEDLMDMKLCMEYGDGKYSILHGRDEILLSGLILGVKGAIGSTYNYITPLFLRIIKAFGRQDFTLANELQIKAMKIVEVLLKFGGGTRAGKSIMRLIGVDLGQPRLPLSPLSTEEEIQLGKDLEALRFRE